MKTLSIRDKKICVERIEGLTLQQIGDGCKPPITRERVRQILNECGFHFPTAMLNNRKCVDCGETLRYRGRAAKRCTACAAKRQNERAEAWRKANPEKFKEQRKRYLATSGFAYSQVMYWAEKYIERKRREELDQEEQL